MFQPFAHAFKILEIGNDRDRWVKNLYLSKLFLLKEPTVVLIVSLILANV